MSVTIKDVAREAELSVATVSRVLNGNAVVSEKSAQKVNEAVKKLNYSPNYLGRNLRKRETNMILCIMPRSEHSLYTKIISGMEGYANKMGYDIIISTSWGRLDMLYNRIVDGAVMLGTSLDAQMLNKLSQNYNIALCCEGVEGANVLTVAVDDEKAAFEAVNVLINKGHKDIAFIGTNSMVSSSAARESGYRMAMNKAGLEIHDELIYKNTYDYECGSLALDKFMNVSRKPTAVFAISDLLAISAIHRACELGITVGKDIDIMGFDNISMCEMMIPTVSTVEQPCEKMGEMVMEKLIDNITGKQKDNGCYTVEHKLILRGSTGN